MDDRGSVSDDWVSKQSTKYGGLNFGEPEQVVKLNLKVYQSIFKYIKPTDTFLDLGCNSAYIAKLVQDKGHKVLAIDLPEVVSKIKYQVPTLGINLEQDFPSGLFNMIWVREVIEHLRDDRKFISNIYGALEKKGILIISAPCTDQDGPRHCPEHVRVYKEVALDDLLKGAGLIILESFVERRSKVCIAIKEDS